MNTIEKIYAPFNYSTSRCHVVPISILHKAYTKIEYKLPSFVKELKAVFVSTTQQGGNKCGGLISLNFNGDALKSVHVPILKSAKLFHVPFSFDEPLKQNSFMQGYFFDMSGTKTFPYRISIYLHYTPVQ